MVFIVCALIYTKPVNSVLPHANSGYHAKYMPNQWMVFIVCALIYTKTVNSVFARCQLRISCKVYAKPVKVFIVSVCTLIYTRTVKCFVTCSDWLLSSGYPSYPLVCKTKWTRVSNHHSSWVLTKKNLVVVGLLFTGLVCTAGFVWLYQIKIQGFFNDNFHFFKDWKLLRFKAQPC